MMAMKKKTPNTTSFCPKSYLSGGWSKLEKRIFLTQKTNNSPPDRKKTKKQKNKTEKKKKPHPGQKRYNENNRSKIRWLKIDLFVNSKFPRALHFFSCRSCFESLSTVRVLAYKIWTHHNDHMWKQKEKKEVWIFRSIWLIQENHSQQMTLKCKINCHGQQYYRRVLTQE